MMNRLTKKLKRPVDNNGGAMLVFVVMMFMLMTLIGTSLLAASSRNHSTAVNSRQSDSAYYIAEAGINHMISNMKAAVNNAKENDEEFETTVDFFDSFDHIYHGEVKVFKDFELTNGIRPEARITVSRIGGPAEESTKSLDYKITSLGSIGDRKRTVSSVITVGWEKSEETPADSPLENVFVYGSTFYFPGNKINGEGGTIVSGALNVSDINGGSTINVSNLFFDGDVKISAGADIGSKNHPGYIYINGNFEISGGADIYGDLYVNGNIKSTNGIVHGKVFVQGDATLSNGTFHNNIYVKGDSEIANMTSNSELYAGGNLKVNWKPEGSFKTYYMGTLTKPDTLSRHFEKVTSIPVVEAFSMPSFTLKLRDNSWFTNNDYLVKSGNYTETNFHEANKNNNTRLVVEGNYTNNMSWDTEHSPRYPKENIVIISKNGNITINGGTKDSQADNFITGVLIAPKGKVNLNGWSFNGIIITEEGTHSSGWTQINMRNLTDFFPTPSKVPFITENESGGGGGSEDPGEDVESTPGVVTAEVFVKTGIREE